jgi:hypothetical protein
LIGRFITDGDNDVDKNDEEVDDDYFDTRRVRTRQTQNDVKNVTENVTSRDVDSVTIIPSIATLLNDPFLTGRTEFGEEGHLFGAKAFGLTAFALTNIFLQQHFL